MLKTLQSKTSGFVAKLILGLVVLAFVVTGFSEFFRGAPSGTVITAGRTQLGLDSYLLAYRRAEVSLSNQLQRRVTRDDARRAGVDAGVLSNLVADAALSEQARRLELGLSEDRVGRFIQDDASFHDGNGNFSRNLFRNVIGSIGMTEDQFVRNERSAAVRSQLVDAVALGAAVPATMKTAFGLYAEERRTVEFVRLAPSLVQPVADPAPEALTSYFDANKGRYRAPEYRSVAYVVATAATLADPSSIGDAEIAQDYERNRTRFATPERRRVLQVNFPDAAAAAVAKTAVDGGATLEATAAAAGRNVIDLGTNGRAGFADARIADTAFSLPPGQVSDVVDGAFGPVLLSVATIEPETVRPLDEVRDEIRRELAETAAASDLTRALESYQDARAAGSPIEEAAQRVGLTVRTIPAIDRTGAGPDGAAVADLPPASEFLEQVFQTNAEIENPTIPLIPNGWLAYDVTKIDPARDRTLDEVRQRVVDDWKADETQRLLGERAAALKKRLDGGEPLAAVAAAENLAIDTAPGITRQSGAGQLGPEGARAAFAGKEGLIAVAAAPDASRIVLRVAGVAPPIDPAAAANAQVSARLDRELQGDLAQAYVEVLRQDFQVGINPQAVERAQAQIR